MTEYQRQTRHLLIQINNKLDLLLAALDEIEYRDSINLDTEPLRDLVDMVEAETQHLLSDLIM